MRPELNINLKIRFFGLYHSDKMQRSEKYQLYPNIVGSFLGLRPLSSLTKEEIIEIGELVGQAPPENFNPSQESTIGLLGKWETQIARYEFPFQIADHLRSKGIVLPFMRYSVEELIQAGWVKLI